MKLYIVTETNTENNLILRSWVCFTKEEADECLKQKYEFACTYAKLGNTDTPSNCLEYGFFFWVLTNGMEVKYSIQETNTFKD